jgi:hypothetical protein
MERVNELAFVVALECFNFSAEFCRAFSHSRLELLQRQIAVHLRVALPQQIEVGTVDKCNFDHH